MTLPFDHTDDLDLDLEVSEFEVALSQEWHGRLTWNEECESSIHDHDIDFSVTMVGWMDVPDSNWGDFRRRHATYISSY